MKLPPEGARWLISLRFGACIGVFVVTTAAWLLGVLRQPLPLYAVGTAVLAYNLVFRLSRRDWAVSLQSVERNILLQILFDLVALALLLYFAGLARNPFLSFFVFHMIIAGMYLRGNLAYLIAAAATCLVGGIMLLEYLAWIPHFDLEFPAGPSGPGRLYLLTVFAALASTLWIAVYFTTAIRRYVDRAHAALRQKEKLLGIGQLVAGIAHEIANPLDGVQNCLQRIGETVRDDPRLAEYVQMMVAALDRIERTAKRVQAFALPHGITLQATDLNAVVEATLPWWGPRAATACGSRRSCTTCRWCKATPTRCKRCSSTSAPTPLPPCPAAERSRSARACWAAATMTRWTPWPSRWPTPAWAFPAPTWRKSSSPFSPPAPNAAAPGWDWDFAAC